MEVPLGLIQQIVDLFSMPSFGADYLLLFLGIITLKALVDTVQNLTDFAYTLHQIFAQLWAIGTLPYVCYKKIFRVQEPLASDFLSSGSHCDPNLTELEPIAQKTTGSFSQATEDQVDRLKCPDLLRQKHKGTVSEETVPLMSFGAHPHLLRRSPGGWTADTVRPRPTHSKSDAAVRIDSPSHNKLVAPDALIARMDSLTRSLAAGQADRARESTAKTTKRQ